MFPLEGDNLHENSKHMFFCENKKNIMSLSSAESAQRVVNVKKLFFEADITSE